LEARPIEHLLGAVSDVSRPGGHESVRNTKLAHQFWFSYPPPGGGSSRSQTDEEKKEKKEAAEALARAEHAQQVPTVCILK
jgi:hypothetical protein